MSIWTTNYAFDSECVFTTLYKPNINVDRYLRGSRVSGEKRWVPFVVGFRIVREQKENCFNIDKLYIRIL